MRETIDSLVFALVLGIIIAYMILGVQFNSFVHPLTVLLAMPFAVTGALVTLWLTGDTLNMMSMIGLILLMGLVKKNSIILVDYTNQLREEGMSVTEAVLKACPVRLRPILMTSVATVAGAIPAAIGLGPGRRDAGADGPRHHRRHRAVHAGDAGAGAGVLRAGGATPAADAVADSEA